MRNLLLFFALFLTLGASAQYTNRPYASTDTVKGDTVYITPGIPFYEYNGIVGFQGTKADVTDSLSIMRMEGSWNGSNWVALTESTTYKTLTTTDGNYFLYDSDPEYLYYRLMLAAASGDTVANSNLIFISKEKGE